MGDDVVGDDAEEEEEEEDATSLLLLVVDAGMSEIGIKVPPGELLTAAARELHEARSSETLLAAAAP